MNAKGGLKTIGADGLRVGDRQREHQGRLLGVNTLEPERCRGGKEKIIQVVERPRCPPVCFIPGS